MIRVYKIEGAGRVGLHMNLISALLTGIFAGPLLAGLLLPFPGGPAHALRTLLARLRTALAGVLAAFITFVCFSHADSILWSRLYAAVPALETSVLNGDLWLTALWATAVWVLLSLLLGGAGRLVQGPLDRLLDRLERRSKALPRPALHVLGGLFRLPEALSLVLSFALLLHGYTLYASNVELAGYVSESAAYRLLDETAIQPALESDLAAKVSSQLDGLMDRAVRSVSLSTLPAVSYYNGVTLAQGVTSSEAVDSLSRALTQDAATDREKALVLYEWVSSNLSYDFDKAELLLEDYWSVSSGALDAYASGSGVCFDYACLYIAMCRAAGVGVRFVSGLGLSDGEWVSHAWNQAYDPLEDCWLNVDATFASTGTSSFDSPDFEDTHLESAILGEWLPE
ncbi:hypothetical protein SDC9_99074 [bioreactor metagenome]|uniref:Transglutaminase-like domain-containing protein n=1 Tax=bioreactor metagenome TaxID=1076179 RepID=A0A645AGJ1_9ZZZZ